ncbi:MAG: hypothetical protein JXB48_22065 [Candidatus Latescibacteria bacterium]|nr:hypothetical protein [Candidatus Latescibacterota bacterium]
MRRHPLFFRGHPRSAYNVKTGRRIIVEEKSATLKTRMGHILTVIRIRSKPAYQ